MKKILTLFIISISFVFAGAKHINVTPTFVESGIKVIDIRTKGEWIQTGIVKNAITITFFDEKGRYDVTKFLQDINKHIDKTKEFAIICRTGNRTTTVANFLGKQGYNVINLKGGIVSLKKQGYKLVPYK